MTVSNPTVLRGGLRIKATTAVNAILDEDTLSSDSNEALATQQSIKAYIDNSVVANRRPKVIAIATSTSAPPTEVSGDRYILDNSGSPHAEWDGATQGDIVQFNGSTWDATTPSEGWVTYSDTDNKDALCVDDGTLQWELRNVAIVNHNDLSNIDGGTSGQYYHMTSAQHTSIVGGSSDASALHHHDGRYYTETEVDNLLPEAGTAAGQMLFYSSGWKHTETSELFYDDTNKRLGIGTASPGYGLDVSGETTLNGSIGATVAADAATTWQIMRRARGTLASKTAVLAGDFIGGTIYNGWINSTWNDAVQIAGRVEATHSTYLSGYFTVETRNSSNSISERFRVTSSGQLTTGGEAAPDVSSGGLCLNQGGEEGFALTFKNSDVGHSFTDAFEADTYFSAKKLNATDGGAYLTGMTEGVVGVTLEGYSETPSSNLSDGGYGSVNIGAYKTNGGTGTAALGTDELTLTVYNASSMLLAIKGGGDLHLLDGGLVLTALTSSASAGAVEWNGSNFRGYTGATWVNLDAQGETNNVEDGTANGQIVFWDTSEYKHTETSEAFWDDTNKRLGIGTSSPSYGLHNAGGDLNEGSIASWRASGDTGSATVQLLKSRGNVASPADVIAGDFLGSVRANARINAAWDPCGHTGFLVAGTHTTYVSSDWYVSLRNSSDSYSELMRLTSAGMLGIGTDSPVYRVHAVGIDANDSTVATYRYNTSGFGSIHRAYSARGTEGTPAAKQDNDDIGFFSFGGYDGNSWEHTAFMKATCDGNWTDSNLGTDIIFYNIANGSTSLTERLRIESTGAVWLDQISAPGTTTDRLYNVSGNLYWNAIQLGVGANPAGSGTEVQYRASGTTFGAAAVTYDSTTESFLFGDTTARFTIASPLQLLGTGTKSLSFGVASSTGADSGSIVFVKGAGTLASPTATPSGHVIGDFTFRGFYGAGWSNVGTGCQIHALASELWDGSQRGTELRFKTVTDGDIDLESRYVIEGDGDQVWYGAGTTPSQIFKIDATNIHVTAPSRAGEPAVVNGAFFYDSTATAFKFGENGSWVEYSAGANPAGTGTEVQYRVDSTTFGATNVSYDATNSGLALGAITSIKHSSFDFQLGLSALSKMVHSVAENSGASNRPVHLLLRAKGTNASPVVVSANFALGSLDFGGLYGASWGLHNTGVALNAYATSTWSGSDTGAKFDISTVNTGASGIAIRYLIAGNSDHVWYGSGTSPTESLRLEADGAILFPDMVAPGTTTNRLYNTTTGLYFDGVRLDVAPGESNNVEDGTAAGQMVFWDGSTEYKHTETSELFWDDTGKRLRAGQFYNDSADLTLATTTSGAIKLDSVGEIHFDDGNISGWTQGYMKFSNASSEWTEFETNFGGEVSLLSAVNQAFEAGTKSVENTDVDTGTEDVDTFADTVAKGATWSYYVSKGTAHRGGFIVASWDASGDTISFQDFSNAGNGDTSDLEFTVDINTNTVRLRAVAASDDWNVQAERKLVARA